MNGPEAFVACTAILVGGILIVALVSAWINRGRNKTK